MDQYIGILVLMALAAVISGVLVTLSWVLGPKTVTPYKSAPYECGVTPVGDAKERFPIKFYLVAIVFILFDIEVVFLWSWMTVFKTSSNEFLTFSFFEFLTYMATWVLGYVYVIKVGAIDWEDSEGTTPETLGRGAVEVIPMENPVLGVGGGTK
jgi:NADH-quinone oxidoreductase subunit A